MMRPTETHRWAWIVHHRLQYGINWRHVAGKYLNKEHQS